MRWENWCGERRGWKIADVIKSLASCYVYYYNTKNERIGHLFQSEPYNDMEYFATLLRYIHQTPVKAGVVDVDNTRRLQNSEVRDFNIEQCGVKSVAEFQRLSPEEQTRVVLDAKAEGVSIRLVMSSTGWSYR